MQALIFLVVLQFSAHAQSALDAIRATEKANKALKEFGKPSCVDCMITSAGQDDPSHELCLSALCPGGHSQFYSQILMAVLTDLNDPEEVAIANLQEKIFKGTLSDNLQSYEAILARLKSNQPIGPGAAVGYVRLMEATNRLGSLVYKADSAGKYTVDIAESRKKLPELTQEDFDNNVEIANAWLDTAASIKFMDDDYDFYVQRHTAAEIQAEVNAALVEVDKKGTVISNAFGLAKETLSASLKPSHIASLRAGNFSRDDLEELKTDLAGSGFLARVFSNKELFAKLSKDSLTPSQLITAEQRTAIETRVDQIKKYLADPSKAPKEIADIHDEVMRACTINLQLAKVMSPTASQLEDFKKRIPGYKNEFFAALSARMSQHSSSVLKTNLDGWKFSLPPVYEDYRDAMKHRLELEYEDLQDTQKQLPVLKANGGELQFATAVVDPDYMGKDFKYAADLKEGCEKSAIEPLRDAAFFGTDKLLAGTASITYEPIGNGKMKHEFGHLTSSLFQDGKMSVASKGWYDRVRTCLQGPKGKDQWVEEDWSDFTSAISNGGPRGCYSIENKPESITTKDPADDEHSADLYRMLHREVLQGRRLPDSCVRLLQDKGETVNIPNCNLVENATPAGK